MIAAGGAQTYTAVAYDSYGNRIGDTVGPHQRQTFFVRCRSHRADHLVAGENGGADLRRGAIENDLHRAGARGAAVLHPRHHLLADIAALVEIDPVQAVHVGLVRERIAVHEVEAAAGNAAGDPMRIIGGAVDQFRADQAGDLLREFLVGQNTFRQIAAAAKNNRTHFLHDATSIADVRRWCDKVSEIFVSSP